MHLPRLAEGGKAACGRCGEVLATNPAHPLDRPLALAIACAIVVVIANIAPLMSLSAAGRSSTTTLAGGAYEMWTHGSEITAAIVGFCAVLAPAMYITSMLLVLLAVQRRRRRPGPARSCVLPIACGRGR